jgi:putative tryptophan/tyrosine transport system substrate-binding protein
MQFAQLKRREFVTFLGGLAVWPLAARAQRTTRPIVGFLNSASADKYAYLAAAFRQGLNDLGFVDGQNITIEYRWAAGQYDRLSEMAADLVRREAAVIAVNTPAVMPAKKATSTIPIVFFTAADPVEAGFVASLNRPGGNLTGISGLQSELGPKRLELLHELVPKATTIALLVNPNNVDVEKLTRDVEATARNLGLEIQVLRASTRRGSQRSLCEAGGHARPPPRHRGRCFPGLAERNTCPSGPTVRGAYNLSTSRVCRGGRPNELWKQP